MNDDHQLRNLLGGKSLQQYIFDEASFRLAEMVDEAMANGTFHVEFLTDGSTKPETFVCGRCGGTYPNDTPEREALAELASHWPGVTPEECAVVCDGCWAAIHPQRN